MTCTHFNAITIGKKKDANSTMVEGGGPWKSDNKIKTPSRPKSEKGGELGGGGGKRGFRCMVVESGGLGKLNSVAQQCGARLI